MARQGYDDTDNIARIEALIAADPGLTRQAAIRSVVGTNKSNIRRIERKMNMVAVDPPKPLPVTMPPTDPASVWSETLCLVTAILLVGTLLGVWTFCPGVIVQAALVVSWLQLKLVILLTGPLGPSGAAALSLVEGYLSTANPAGLNPSILTGLRQDVLEACRAFMAGIITATMVVSIWRLSSLPQDRPSSNIGDGSDVLRLVDRLRNPRNATTAVVMAGGLGCMVPALFDVVFLTVILITWNALRSLETPLAGTKR